jgi:mono/diheme cytochrome c family protein
MTRQRDFPGQRILGAPVVLALTLLAPFDVLAAEQAGSVSEGKQLYQQACAPCHGSNGRGQGPVAAALMKQPTDLTQLSARNAAVFPREEIIAVVSGEREVAGHGSREMPVWSQRFAPAGKGATAVASVYARRRLELLSGFLESIQEISEAPVPTATPAGLQ